MFHNQINKIQIAQLQLDESWLILGSQIKAARVRAGLSTQQLAELCGWTHRLQVWKYETGVRRPSPQTLEKIELAIKGWHSPDNNL